MTEQTTSAARSTKFVAREQELAQLDTYLDQALAGQGQICFVTGEAGDGKTALVTEFARRAQEQHTDLVVAFGVCDPQTGVGTPYLPFREIMEMLTGDTEDQVAAGLTTQENAKRLHDLFQMSGEALLKYGPDLVGVFVPGAGLVAELGAAMAERAGWLDRLTSRAEDAPSLEHQPVEQSQIFEQYVNVLKAMAERAPLLLVLDDAQWADTSSIGLLFHLTRRFDDSRIFIVGTYRPADVATGRRGERHPLERVLAELKRHRGAITIDLETTRRAGGLAFVEAFLDTEPNRLGADFRQALFQRTGGQPLFVIELLRDMQERGDLVRDGSGCWVEGPALDWSQLPARAEGVIEERIGRLATELRETLELASVQGEAFIAEVLAAVQEVEARNFVRRLNGDLERRHHLVRAEGQERVGQRRLSHYRFQNQLFQRYLYDGLNPSERAYLHEDIGRVLEEVYGEQTDGIAVELVWHFEEAGLPEKARHYLRVAGKQAAAGAAHAEAVDYLSRALDLTPKENLAERYDLLLAREGVRGLQGAREAQSKDLEALARLAEGLEDAERQAEGALRRARQAVDMSDYAAAVAGAQAAIEHAQAAGDRAREGAARRLWGEALWRQGEYPAAREQLAAALRLARKAGARREEATCLRHLGVVYLYTDDYAGAQAAFGQSLHICRKIGDRWGERSNLNNLGVAATKQGRYADARDLFEQAQRIAHEAGTFVGENYALGNLGWLFCRMGDYTAARSYAEQSLRLSREIEKRSLEAEALATLSRVVLALGDAAAALIHAREARDLTQELGDWESGRQALLALGDVLTAQQEWEDAAAAYREVADRARELGETSAALEGLAGLARVAWAQGDPSTEPVWSSSKGSGRAGAEAYVDEIMAHLDAGSSLDGAEEPFRVYLTCFLVLEANQDDRAPTVLASAYRHLQAQAALIGDEELRRGFQENVAAHRELAAAVERVFPDGLPPQPEEALPPAAPVAAVTPEEAPGLALPESIPEAALPAEVAAAAPVPVAEPARPVAEAPVVADAPVQSSAAPEAARPVAPGPPKVDLSGVGLAGAILNAANLAGCRLRGVDFSHAQLRVANLQHADLFAAVLCEADLQGADLQGANLCGADLQGADLRAADLSGAIYNGETRWPEGYTPPPEAVQRD